MVSYPNRLYKGWCSNQGNSRSHIMAYHIITVRDLKGPDGERIPDEIKTLEEYFNLDNLTDDDPYYAVYGTFKIDIPRSPTKIFETDSLRIAIFILEEMTGNKVIEQSYE